MTKVMPLPDGAKSALV